MKMDKIDKNDEVIHDTVSVTKPLLVPLCTDHRGHLKPNV